MAENESAPRWKVGEWVNIRHSGYPRARVVEDRGRLGPGGAQVYRVILSRKPKPVFIEVLEDQLLPLPAEG